MQTCRWLASTLVLSAALGAQEPQPFPLDPLSRDEIVATTATLMASNKIHPATRFGSITLHEPAKADVLVAAVDGTSAPRLASVMIYDWATGVTSTGTINPQRHTIVSWSDLPPADPPIFYTTIMRTTEIALADRRFRTAVAKRGYTDPSRLRVEPNVESDYRLPLHNGDRVVEAGVFDQDALGIGDSPDLSGIRLYENLARGTLDSIRDSAVSTARGHHAEVLRPVAQPDRLGESKNAVSGIAVRGTAIRWGRWRIRAGVDPRRGLELYDVGFADQGRVRSILYRASVSEMIAPYGDPQFRSWYPMDEGDVGLAGYGMTGAVPGEDAPANAVFLPAVFADDQGHPTELQRAVAIFERETDVQWRHAHSALRARELVIRSLCTADNYDYVFDWIFREDGSIRVQVAPTGIINAYPMAERGEASGLVTAPTISSHRVGMHTIGPIHQHFFSYRLDFDVDGPDHNRVVELRPRPMRSATDNPRGEWFAVERHPIATEQDALHDSSVTASRWWLVLSARDTNALGQPTGYALIPGENTPPYESPMAPPRLRARFVTHELWVTPYRPDEMYAAGEVPSHDTTAQGLPRWTAANRPVDDADVVLWYTLGLTHLPRTEDWPVMPTYPVSFRLVPAGFFSQDPALSPAAH